MIICDSRWIKSGNETKLAKCSSSPWLAMCEKQTQHVHCVVICKGMRGSKVACCIQSSFERFAKRNENLYTSRFLFARRKAKPCKREPTQYAPREELTLSRICCTGYSTYCDQRPRKCELRINVVIAFQHIRYCGVKVVKDVSVKE